MLVSVGHMIGTKLQRDRSEKVFEKLHDPMDFSRSWVHEDKSWIERHTPMT